MQTCFVLGLKGVGAVWAESCWCETLPAESAEQPTESLKTGKWLLVTPAIMSGKNVDGTVAPYLPRWGFNCSVSPQTSNT